MMKRRLPILLVCVLLATTLVGCNANEDTAPEIGEYKPAIMVDDQIYWLSPTGNVSTIPDTCEVIGHIEKISAPTTPPGENWEAIGFSDDFLQADIYQSEDGYTIYVYNPDQKQYIPFEIGTE